MKGLLAIVACALVGGIYAGSESGAYRLNRVRVERQAARGSFLARVLRSLVADMERFVCVTLVSTNIAYYFASFFCAREVQRFFHRPLHAEFAATFLLSPFLLIVAEIVPKTIFQARPNILLRWTAPLLWVSDKAFLPVVLLLRGIILFWQRLLGGRRAAGEPVVTSQYLHFYLREGAQEGVITQEQDAMARNLMEFGARPLRTAMIPLGEVRMLPRHAARAEVDALVAQYDCQRIPIYEGSRESIVGILLVFDYLCQGGADDLSKVMVPPVFLDEGMTLKDGFEKLQSAGQTMGVVADGQGRAVGIVTMGDVLQSVFGSLDEK